MGRQSSAHLMFTTPCRQGNKCLAALVALLGLLGVCNSQALPSGRLPIRANKYLLGVFIVHWNCSPPALRATSPLKQGGAIDISFPFGRFCPLSPFRPLEYQTCYLSLSFRHCRRPLVISSLMPPFSRKSCLTRSK